MKALTLTQPWASLVASGRKQVETRSWYSSYRGPLYIHAAKRFPTSAKRFAAELSGNPATVRYMPLGAIVARCYLLDCRTVEHVQVTEQERKYGDYSPGRYAWILTNIEWLEPTPCKGALGLWNVPAEVLHLLYDKNHAWLQRKDILRLF